MRQLCSTIVRSALAFVAVASVATLSSQAAVQNRITADARSTSRVALAHTVSSKAATAQDLGLAPSSLKLENVRLHFNLTDTQQAALSELLVNQQNPSSPLYRQWLTPQQFGAQFGLSASDLASVTSWLTAQGFTITGTAKSSTYIAFSGTVGQVQQAFGTTIHNLSLRGEQHMANLTDPTLPSAIAAVVANISGLDDFKLKPRIRKTTRWKNPSDPKLSINVCTNSACTATEISHYITPGDFATIYDTAPLLAASTNGTGVKIAIMGQVDILPADIAAFRTASGLSANVPTVVTYGTDPGAAQTSCPTNSSTFCATDDDLDESELDIEWAGAVAPSASIIFVNSTDVIGTSLVDAIDNLVAPILSVSYGGCEVTDFSVASMNSLNITFQQANAQGITIVGPSGDTGATDCENNGGTVATTGLAVDYPASSPYVTGVGGTEFSEGADAATTGTYWNNSTASATSPAISTALSYIPEMVWNDTASELASNPTGASFSAGGGGASSVFAKPSWQTGTGVPNDSHRDVPDLAFSASADHDAYMVCAQGSCDGGTYFTTTTGAFNAFGGTSVSTPSFAGVLALVEQKLGGVSLGNVNPYIYALANGSSYASIFHDVTVGNNKQVCTVGTTGCTSSPIGFSAGVGYDQASGWGSLDVNQFATKFSSVVIALPIATSITLTSSVANPALNAAVTFTATVAPASGTATPTGTVSFTVDGGAATTETVTSTTAAFPATFTVNGTHTVQAVYSGDTNYYGSSTTTTIIAGTIPTGSISLSASPAAITVASAGNISSVITLTSAGGYVGTVNLTAVANALNGSYIFTPTAVTLTSGGTGTSTFTVSSVSAASNGAGGLKRRGEMSKLIAGGGVTLAGLLLFGLSGKRRRGVSTLLSLLVLTGLFAGMGCGSSSSTTTTGTTTGTGTFNVTITGTDSLTNAITSSTTIAVTLK